MQFQLMCYKNPEAFDNAFLEHLKALSVGGWMGGGSIYGVWIEASVTGDTARGDCLLPLRDSHPSDRDRGGCGAVESTPAGQNTHLKSSNHSWLKPSEITSKEISFCKIKVFLEWTGVFFFPICTYRSSRVSRDRIIWKQQTCLKSYSPPLCGQGCFTAKTAVYVQPLIPSLITQERHSHFCPPLKNNVLLQNL